MYKPIIATALALSFTFINPCTHESKIEKPKANDTVYDVTVVYPKFISVPKKYHVPGSIDYSETSYVIASANGTIEQVFVTEGDKVVKDDPLVSITNNNLLDKIDLKRSRIKEYQARLDAIQAELDVTMGEDRPVSIEDTQFLDDDPVEDEPIMKKFGDSEDKPKAPSTIKALANVLEKAIDVLQKEANVLDKKLLDLSLSSPVEGMVTTLMVSEGNKVKEKEKMVAVSQTNPMSVTFHLPEETASHIDKSSNVKVVPYDAGDVDGEGTVYYISPNINSTTGKIEVRAHISNEEGKLKGGQKADVYVSTRKMGRVVVLPKRVLAYDNNKTYVFVAFRGQAKRTEVMLGDELEGGSVQIHGDLRVDDPIIIDRPVELTHNSFIKIKEQEPAVKDVSDVVVKAKTEETKDEDTKDEE